MFPSKQNQPLAKLSIAIALGTSCLSFAANAALDSTISPTPTIHGTSGTPSGTTGSVATSIGTINIGTNFTGTSIGQSGFTPPDTMGAVGPNHIVELINGRYVVYDRNGSIQTASSLNAFWTSAGVTPAGPYAFDPRVIYDPSSSRWYATAVDNARSANSEILLGVSNSSDPTAGWTGFAVDADTANTRWADFPMLGITGDRITVTANMFGIPGTITPPDVSIYTIAKSDLIAGNAIGMTKFETITPNAAGFTIQPIVDLDNSTAPQTLLSAYNKPVGYLKASSLSGSPTNPTLNTTGGFISVTPRNEPPTIDQPGTAQNISVNDSRFSSNVIKKQITGRANPSIFATHNVNIDGRAGIEWYEIDAVTNTLLQSGTIADPSLGFNYPSIAVNSDGDIVIGFSGSDPSTFMGSYAVVGDTVNGTTTFSAPILLKTGEADYERLDGSNRNRWGDYSATVIDPNDPNSFWTFQTFVAADGTGGVASDVWATQITQIIVPEPGSGIIAMIGIVGFATRRRRAV